MWVDRCGLLGQHGRVPVGVAGHQRAEADPGNGDAANPASTEKHSCIGWSSWPASLGMK